MNGYLCIRESRKKNKGFHYNSFPIVLILEPHESKDFKTYFNCVLFRAPMCVRTAWAHVWVRGQLSGVRSLLSCGSLGLNSGHQPC